MNGNYELCRKKCLEKVYIPRKTMNGQNIPNSNQIMKPKISKLTNLTSKNWK